MQPIISRKILIFPYYKSVSFEIHTSHIWKYDFQCSIGVERKGPKSFWWINRRSLDVGEVGDFTFLKLLEEQLYILC